MKEGMKDLILRSSFSRWQLLAINNDDVASGRNFIGIFGDQVYDGAIFKNLLILILNLIRSSSSD